MSRATRAGRGIVVAPQAEAAFEGACVLREGGNAADALVAAALVQGVVDPHRCGIGGFGCSTVLFPSRGGALAIDFHGRAGGRARAEQWEGLFESEAADGFGYVIKGKHNDLGYQSITVPGVVAGLAEVHRRFGTMPWRELVARAAPYAEDGFLVTVNLVEHWTRPDGQGRATARERLALTEEGRRICLRPGGEVYRAGEVFKQPELGRTYRRLADEGPESFYRGPLAEDMLRDLEANGALLGAEDLGSYRAQAHPPLEGAYRGLALVTTPLPGGGPALLQALKLLEGEDLAGLGHNGPDYVERLARALGAALLDRLANHGDPAFGARTAAELLAPDYLAALAAGGRAQGGADAPDTTQLSILDGEGNAISFSHSLGYASGVFSPGLGFMYNNCMSGFDPRPGRTNSLAPGKARTTAVAETIALRGDGSAGLVLGSPGAAKITAGLVQVLANVVDFGMNVAEAVVHPRFYAFGDRGLEFDARAPRSLVAELARRGFRVTQSPRPFGVVGRVYAIEAPAGGGPPVAGVDPGEPGAAFRALDERPPLLLLGHGGAGPRGRLGPGRARGGGRGVAVGLARPRGGAAGVEARHARRCEGQAARAGGGGLALAADEHAGVAGAQVELGENFGRQRRARGEGGHGQPAAVGAALDHRLGAEAPGEQARDVGGHAAAERGEDLVLAELAVAGKERNHERALRAHEQVRFVARGAHRPEKLVERELPLYLRRQEGAAEEIGLVPRAPDVDLVQLVERVGDEPARGAVGRPHEVREVGHRQARFGLFEWHGLAARLGRQAVEAQDEVGRGRELALFAGELDGVEEHASGPRGRPAGRGTTGTKAARAPRPVAISVQRRA